MGCVSSKPPVCRNCQKPCSPIHRTKSMSVHHPPQRRGDSYHVVSLTSSTLGSLRLDPLNQSTNSTRSTITSTHSCTPPTQNGEYFQNQNQIGKGNKDFLLELVEAKTWSKMIDEKIPKISPKTPVRTPPGEPETINEWELMEGLEDGSPLPPSHYRSFTFSVAPNFNEDNFTDPNKSKTEENPKPIWLGKSESNLNSPSIVFDFDADVIKTFRKTLEELPPANPFHLNPSDEKNSNFKGYINETNEKNSNFNETNQANEKPIKVLHKMEKVIVYFTTLRGVRKTYEDCCNVRVILKGIGIKVDERDVSMHSGFREELKELLKDNGINGIGLPKVFIGKKYFGGIDEIRLLNEEGRLGVALDGCEKLSDGQGVCDACGDVRFVPCETCSGSCKIYYSDDDDEDEEVDKQERYGFERCPDCNENGLIRCPICCE